MNSKKLIGLLFIGYSLLGLRLAGANDLQLPTDTTENGGVRAEASLVEAVADMVAKSTAEATKLSAEITEINARAAAGEITEDQAEAEIAAAEAAFEARMEVLSSSMEEWGESFGERMEKWGESFGKRLEEDLEDLNDIDIDIDLDIAELEEEEEEEEEEKPKTKVGVFYFHLGPNALVLSDRSMASAMDNINAGLSWESRVFFGQKRRIGGVKSPLQCETGFGIGSNIFSFKNGMTIDKDPMMFGVANLLPISGLSNVRRSNWNISTTDVPAILHLDFSPKGTFNEGLNIGFGVIGRMRYLSQARYVGNDLDGNYYREVRTNGFHTRLFNYALVGQLGYKKLKITGKLEQLPLFKDSYFQEQVYLGSITIGFSLN